MARNIGQMYDYDNERFTEASSSAIRAIEEMVSAGGSSADIENTIKDGLDNAGVGNPTVEVGGEWTVE